MIGMAFSQTVNEDVIASACVTALDARIKLGVLCVMLAVIFSSHGVWRLSVLTIFILGLCVVARISVVRILRRMLVLRWLLLAGPVLHLVQGSGRTLMGVSFLSFEGLLKGVIVSWQFALAVVCSSLFCWTTSVPALFGAFRRLAGPLHRSGACRRLGRHMMLVWLWIPLVQEETLALRRVEMGRSGCRGGLRTLMTQVFDLFDRLLALSDGLILRGLAESEGAGASAMPTAPGIGIRDICILSIALVSGLLWCWGLP
jgi:energy-coupling factor transporter transmembrane protein EcfT